MATVRELITKLGFDVDTSALRRFDVHIGNIKKRLEGTLHNTRAVSRSVRDFGRDASLFISAPLALLGLQAVKTASNFEQMQIAFETMLGSSEKATKLISDITTLAAKTPFTLPEVQEGAKQLLAMGFAAEDIVETTRRLGDVSAGLSVPLQRILYNYGQIRNTVVASAIDIKQFAIAGVPIYEELAKILGISVSQVKDYGSQGKITFKIVEQAFKNMTSEGGKFFNLMEKQSQSTAGQFSNLLDSLIIVSKQFGELLIEQLKINEVISFLKRGVETLSRTFKDMTPRVRFLTAALFALLIIVPPLIFALGTLGLALTGIAALMGIISLPILLLIGKILLIGVTLWLVYDDLSSWVEGSKSLIGSLLGDFETFRSKFLEFLSDIQDGLILLFTGNFSRALDSFKSSAMFVLDVLKDIGGFLDRLSGGRIAELINQYLPRASGSDIGGARALPGLGSVASGGGSTKSINVDSKITVQVPNGTSQEQQKYINNDVRKVVRQELDKTFSNAVYSNPVVEY